MQDVHWPSGAFGYFPAYTLGALIAAQLYEAALIEFPDIPTQIGDGNFMPLLNWLQKNIHQYGSKYKFNDLIVKATGNSLDAKYYLDHIKKRYF